MRKGFTLVELMIVLGILATLFGIGTARFMGVQNKSQLGEASDILITDLAHQHINAMTGVKDLEGNIPAGYGIYFQTDRYILFAGDVYTASDTHNMIVMLPPGVSLNTTFPDSTIVFQRPSGDVKNFVAPSNTIDLVSEGVATTTHFSINQLGVIAEGI